MTQVRLSYIYLEDRIFKKVQMGSAWITLKIEPCSDKTTF